MAYTINRYNGRELLVLADGTIDTSTSLGLVGRNYVGYGETQNENFVFLLENFANDAPPSRPLQGQIWFNTTNKLTYVYDGNDWALIGSAVLSDIPPNQSTEDNPNPPTPSLGSLWLRTPINTLNVWTGNSWAFIGPEAAPGFGTTRARSGILTDSNGTSRPVIFLEVNDIILGVCTAVAFTINPNNSIPNLSNNLIAGINLANTFRINGSITGNSGSATKLENVRTINDIAFDGTTDVIIRASTTNRLIKGSFLTGSNFDGSQEVTLDVDATSANVIGKVVARNSSGGFAAGTITADLVGNVTGNVNSDGTSNFNIVTATEFIGATLTGNAASATRLATERKINGVNFNGTSDITVTASAGTLTGNILNSSVTISSLNQVGTLTNLSVADVGVSIGSGSQLRIFTDAGVPTVRSSTGQLNFDIGASGPDISFINSTTSVALGGPNAPAIIGDNNTNLGINGYKFNNIYANNFLGNATSATTAVTSTNIAGGGPGSLPYQTATGTTSFLNIGADGYVLRARPGNTIQWEALNFEQLNRGSYLNFVNTNTGGSVSAFNSSIPVSISVDATPSNVGNTVIARDGNGNFSAGTITANLTGSASSNVLKSGDTMSGFLTLHSNPVNSLHAATKLYVDTAIGSIQYYDEFANNTASPGPQSFPQRSIRGFSAYSSTDFPGLYFGGITVSGPSGVYSGQLAFNWNSEEGAPTGLYFRVNDDTSNTAAWSAWKQVATKDTTPLFVSGASSTVGFTNIVGSWNFNSNYFDVFPPAGRSMSNLVAFTPSIRVIQFAGGVNGDDSMVCTYSYLGDRIRVYVQNTEQRGLAAANYMAIWS